MLPLEGYRIIEFGFAVAGGTPGLLLADLGAEVIKVESREHLDGLRLGVGARKDIPDPEERNPHFHWVNRNKLGVTVNMKHPRGVEMVLRLAAQSDALVENYSAGTLESLGIGYAALRAARPDIVVVSLTGAGQTGPQRDLLAYANVMSSLAGLEALIGYPDEGEPLLAYPAYSDMSTATHAALATLLALFHRRRTGEGQHVDVSGWESTTSLLGPALMDYALNKRVQGLQGNRHQSVAPHGVYPCKGENRWIALAVEDDDAWEGLRRAMGDPEWAADPALADGYGRVQRRDDLETRVAAWTRERAVEELVPLLERAGVTVAPAATPTELARDPHFRQRGVFMEITHPRTGEEVTSVAPWQVGPEPLRVRRPTPVVGEHTRYIFREVLGLADAEADALEREKALY